MTNEDIERIAEEFRAHYPALINFVQAAAIALCPLGTIENYSQRGLFDSFKIRLGKRALLDRDAFVRFVLTREAQINSIAQVPISTTNNIAECAPAPRAASGYKTESNA